MERVILHSDLNHFYAAVECFHNPEIRNKPVAVVGDVEARHGIILTKNPIAKKYGVQTGEPIWQARGKCPDLVTVPANFSLYLKYSKAVRAIYQDYTDCIEPFGIDEAWLDVSGSTELFGSGEEIAHIIRNRIKEELGLTVSIGVSYNKIFAKLGSDIKKPDAVTVISKDNYKDVAWLLPVEDLLYVGRSTKRKLKMMGVYTIGDLAKADIKMLKNRLGVWAFVLQRFAAGEDNSPVAKGSEADYIKSVGNSITAPRDLMNIDDIQAIVYMLSESVASRLRDHGLKCTGVQIHVRDKELQSCDRQMPLKTPTYITDEIAEKAIEIFQKKYKFQKPVRSIGVRGINLVSEDESIQLNLFLNEEHRKRQELAERAIDDLRHRFGPGIVERGIKMMDPALTGISPKEDHIIHPVAFFKSGSIQ